jgi:hypothetical protein
VKRTVMIEAVCLGVSSFLVGAAVCKIIHESGHALTAWALGGTIESVRVHLPTRPGFVRIEYLLPAGGWRKGLADLMGTGATTIVAYGLVLAVLAHRSQVWPRFVLLPVSLVCAWDMFLYGTLPLLGLRRFLVFGGRHAEPVSGAGMVGIPKWLFLLMLALSFIVFHYLWCRALPKHGGPGPY